MRLTALILLFLSLLPAPLRAGEITAQPICFTIRNDADHRVYGEVSTDYVTDKDGQKIRHTGSFRLEAKGTKDPKTGYEKDITEFCSSGPFYPDRQLELTLRTLVPVFSCKTSIELGEIVIHSQKQVKDGVETYKTWATCY